MAFKVNFKQKDDAKDGESDHDICVSIPMAKPMTEFWFVTIVLIGAAVFFYLLSSLTSANNFMGVEYNSNESFTNAEIIIKKADRTTMVGRQIFPYVTTRNNAVFMFNNLTAAQWKAIQYGANYTYYIRLNKSGTFKYVDSLNATVGYFGRQNIAETYGTTTVGMYMNKTDLIIGNITGWV